MFGKLDENKFKGKIIDHIETGIENDDYYKVCFYFTDNTFLEIIASGEDSNLTLWEN